MAFVILCHCVCHAYSTIAEFKAADVRNPVDAALACDSCRDSHCDALLLTRLANDPEPERHEKFPWIDDLCFPSKPEPPAIGGPSGEDGG